MNAVRSRPVCRRQFLRGAGGVAVGLPFLPSLAGGAFAQDPVFPREKFFYIVNTDHGAAYDSNMFPDVATLTQQMTYAAAGHTIRWGNLVGRAAGTSTSLSPVLTASASKLPPSMIGKLNVLYGLDTAMKIGHNSGAVLGNFADGSSNSYRIEARPTIDQIMAWSPSFYPSLQGIRERSLTYGPSWGFSNPTTQSGTIQRVNTDRGTRDLFDRIFVPSGTVMMPAPRRSIVDRVLANYRTLRDGNRRLSLDDRQRLDNHLSRLAELQRRLDADVRPSRTCSNVSRPVEDSRPRYGDGYTFTDFKKYASLYNDVYAAAFACGSSRIVTANAFRFHTAFFAGNWHQDIAHQYLLPASQTQLTSFYSQFFESVFLDLAGKLDAIVSTPGRTVLDDSLLVWTQESGMDTHYPISIPVVTAGGAGGYLKTGMFIDYRNQQSTTLRRLSGSLPVRDRTQYFGLLYNQFLATALRAMNVPATEFERWGHKGYGVPGFGTVPTEEPEAPIKAYYQGANSKYFQIASDPLPVLTA